MDADVINTPSLDTNTVNTPSTYTSTIDTPLEEAGTISTPSVDSGVGVKAKLDVIQDGPRPRFNFKIARDQTATNSQGNGDIDQWTRLSFDSILRRVARDARWNAFLFHGSYYWADILSQYFLPPGQSKDNLPGDDEEVLRLKTKVLDTIRNLKSDTLKKFTTHVTQAMVDHPELATIDLTIPSVGKNFFIDNIWSERNFEYIWFWMQGYVDIGKSSELAKYYNKRESLDLFSIVSSLYLVVIYIEIYGSLCYVTLLIKRSRPQEADFHIRQRHLLYYQCVTESNFDSVTMSEFCEIRGQSRGDRVRTTRIAAAADTFAMMGDMPPPPPPRSN